MSSFPTLRAALRSPTKIAISARGCKYGECRFGLLQIVFVADIPEILVSLYTHLCSQNIPVIIAARIWGAHTSTTTKSRRDKSRAMNYVADNDTSYIHK